MLSPVYLIAPRLLLDLPDLKSQFLRSYFTLGLKGLNSCHRVGASSMSNSSKLHSSVAFSIGYILMSYITDTIDKGTQSVCSSSASASSTVLPSEV